jgi:hypothetical protein
MEIKVLNNQSLFDIALQAAGSIESVFDIAATNGIEITAELPTGMVLTIPKVVNRRIVEYYRVNGIVPATALEASKQQEGIDFWTVEYDFIVS